MKKNLVRKILPVSYSTWTAPAGVEEVIVTVLDRFDQLISSGRVSLFLRKTGAAYAVGLGTSGQLGDGTIISKSTPVPVTGGHSFVSIGTNTNFSYCIALKADGSAWTWGSGLSGNLGDGTIVNKSSPIQVIGGHSFIAISNSVSGSEATSLALKANGSVWTWGQNNSGQLGDGTSVNKSSPVQVIGGHSFIKIHSGNGCSIALKDDGSAWAWGNNLSGQIGDNTIINKSSPVPVVGGHSFISVSSGNASSCGLKADGSVWTWGVNNYGQLGDGTIVAKSSPIQVIGGHSFISLGSGNLSYLALKADGSAWAWGSGGFGNLGDGTVVDKSSPVQVIGGHSFIQISAGFNVVSALKANGTVWAWGNNSSGEIGDNTIINKSSPVQVLGGFTFEAGVQYANRRTFTVTPGTTYNINGFLTSIGAQVMLSAAQNNCYIVLEYYG